MAIWLKPWVQPTFLRPHVLHLYIAVEYLKAFAMALVACTLVMLIGFLIPTRWDYEQ